MRICLKMVCMYVCLKPSTLSTGSKLVEALYRSVDLSILIICVSPFLVIGVSGEYFHFSCAVFCSIEIPVSKPCRP